MASSDNPKPVTTDLGSTEPEKKIPMEDDATEAQSTEAGSSSLNKRKADVHDLSDAADGDEGGEDSDDGEEMDEDDDDDSSDDDCWSKWGKDSDPFSFFAIHDFDAASEEYKNKWRRYMRLVRESEGFRVDIEDVPEDILTGVGPIDLKLGYCDGTVHDMAKELASMALERYNQDKGLDVKFESIVRVNMKGGGGFWFDITFMARESAEGDPVEYQAKVLQYIVGPKSFPIFCRPSPKP